LRPAVREIERRHSLLLLLATAVIAGVSLAAPGPGSMMAAYAQFVADDEAAETMAEDASDEDMYLHTVQWPGETLALIAEWYTGDSKNWTVLSDFNAGYGSDAVQLSQVILIPKFLLITTTPMPRSFVAPLPQPEGPRLPPRKTVQRPKSRPKPRVKKEADPRARAERAPAPTPETETLELFGPKE
jgi:hypothetical protein